MDKFFEEKKKKDRRKGQVWLIDPY